MGLFLQKYIFFAISNSVSLLKKIKIQHRDTKDTEFHRENISAFVAKKKIFLFGI